MNWSLETAKPDETIAFGQSRKAASAPAALFSGRLRLLHVLGIAAWFGALLYFWQWWLDPAHVVDWPSYVLITVVVGWITLLPVYFIVIFSGAKVMAASAVRVPQGRVAMVVTKAPS
ncbi:MAG: N-acetylglucosaminyltransferase, partial [Ensifer adhaerens]